MSSADILTDPLWDDYRERLLPYGIALFRRAPCSPVKARLSVLFPWIVMDDVAQRHRPPLMRRGYVSRIAIERHMKEEVLQHRPDRLRLLLEITNSMTFQLDLRGLVDVLSTNLLKVTRCDFCALLLPDGNEGALRLTVLYNPKSRGFLHDGMNVPLHGRSHMAKFFEPERVNRLAV